MGRAKRTAGWGGGGFSAKAVKGRLGKLNQGHRSLIVAESVDASTDRIVRCLAEIGAPINVATVSASKMPMAVAGLSVVLKGQPRPQGESRHSRLMKNASLGYRERAGVVIEAPLDADSE